MSDVNTEILALLKAQQEQIAALQAQVASKGKRKPKAKRERPEGMPSEPSSFKVPGNGPFGLYVPDGCCGATSTTPPQAPMIRVNKRDRNEIGPDGLCVVTDSRVYFAGKNGWKRSKKGTGWCSYYPTRVDDESAFDAE